MPEVQKEPHHIDKYVGQMVRNYRRKKGLTQKELGESIDVKFQQVQKYEIGTNRISASKLCMIADYLDLPVAAFFPDEYQDKGFNPQEAALIGMFRDGSREARSAILALVPKVTAPGADTMIVTVST